MSLQLLTALCFGLVLISPPCQTSREGVIIRDWAALLGRELWELGQTITKADEIKSKYTALNVRVEEKDGMQLLESAVQSVQRMLTRKTDAIKCILEKAEYVADQFDLNETSPNFTYSSSKYSEVYGEEPRENVPRDFIKNKHHYRELVLNEDSHFAYIPVNTSHSSVHVPTNIYDKDPTALEAILWSEDLDEVFVQNYNSDPALSWQYFCSASGILRHYPAMKWDEEMQDSITYDCRTRSWYIEAATCSKDVVILFDISGSMTGYGFYVAKYTVRAILQTLSNNDFLNIFTFTNDTTVAVECFTKLVQATPENIQTLRDAMDSLKPEGNANLTLAFTKAFELLAEYRLTRNCTHSNLGCNQMIMLVTDGVSSNFTEIFDKYNRFENGTYIPVRVFTYLIGKEVTKVKEIQDIACSNRGFYAHIHTIDEVQQQVLKYINVIARPLVLQKNDHPPTWTHAYLDMNKGEADAAMMTSVAVPAFDTKTNRDNSSETAELLGVAGTDVPIADIGKLALPYKMGVNGYAFVVSNNGYLLMHPDLRPVYHNLSYINYNSVDLVEVEMIDDNLEIRTLGPDILRLRDAMVSDDEIGIIPNLSIRFHYDQMRRVSREKQDYYYAPIKDTPFSLGIALPHDYGNTWIKVGDEIKRNQNMGINISSYFEGDNWKVHPKWVYCKYHYLENHEFNNSEDELHHFLRKMARKDWKWSEQYEEDVNEDATTDNCSRKTLDDDAYFCNKELVQLLVYDAKLTFDHFHQHSFSESEYAMFEVYNSTLRFVATMSGLTRWQYIYEEGNDTDYEFGDYHTNAIDETWYKSAILQHNIWPDSFVFSVPFDSGSSQYDEDITVIASLAIFPRDGGLEAPGSVVGYEFSHTKLLDRFWNITSSHKSVENCMNCLRSCSHGEHTCFVIDGSGYVVLSENRNDTGRFFGSVEGAIMKNMVTKGIYHKVTIYDLQGVCNQTNMSDPNASNIIQTPFTMTKHIFNWFLAKVVWLVAEFQISQIWDACLVFSLPADIDDDYYEDAYHDMGPTDKGNSSKPKPRTTSSTRTGLKNANEELEEYFSQLRRPKPVTVIYPCDKKVNLFVLKQKVFLDGDGFMAIDNNYSRPFYVALIPHTNLILLVVDIEHPAENQSEKYEVTDSNVREPGPPCHKLDLADLPRRRLKGCFTDHEGESKINMCGSAGRVQATIVLTAAILSLLLVAFRLNFILI